ncbi:MAG TPA: chemotaxis protein CheC [Longimicrobiaceae bacterium]|jgi:chemotaxis protein CheC|nr:chemotaxis protein CheC [Longimicrobiaceae bacterium]
MLDVRELHELEIDALREVANIGAGHAATALSQMTSRRIMVNVPRLQIVRLEDVAELIAEPDQVVAAVLMHMLGDLTGRTLLVFPRDAAMRLSEILLNRPLGTSRIFGELEQSAIKEAGNILSAAYMNALSDFMGMMLLPSVPSLVVDQCAAVLTTTYTNFGDDRDFAFSIETQFTMGDEEEAVQAHFLLLPDVESLRIILSSIHLR